MLKHAEGICTTPPSRQLKNYLFQRQTIERTVLSLQSSISLKLNNFFASYVSLDDNIVEQRRLVGDEVYLHII